MSRPVSALSTAEAIHEVAARMFFEHGYEATSLREIAKGVGLQVGSLYNHISGKEELLTSIMMSIMSDLISAFQASVAQVTHPVDALRAAIDLHIRFHAERARDVFIGNSELRSLSPAHRRRVTAERRRYEAMLSSAIDAAATARQVDVLDTRIQTYSIIALGAHLSSWYTSRGPRSLDELVDVYTELIMRQLSISHDQPAPDLAG